MHTHNATHNARCACCGLRTPANDLKPLTAEQAAAALHNAAGDLCCPACGDDLAESFAAEVSA